MTQDELATMDGGKCILQIRGVRPFLSAKFDLTKHPNYKYLSDADLANAFDPQAYLNRALHPKDEDTFDAYEIEDDEPEEDVPIDLDVVMYYTTLNLKTFDYPLTTSNAFDHICRQQTYGFA